MTKLVLRSLIVALSTSILALSPAVAQEQTAREPAAAAKPAKPKKAKPQARRAAPQPKPSDDMLSGQGQFRPPTHDELMGGAGGDDGPAIKPLIRRGGAGVGLPF
jgi:hypothetical protein